MAREIRGDEREALLSLYLHLHEQSVPNVDGHLETVWQQIQSDSNHHIVVAECDEMVVASCVCVVIPNLTRNVRPYALVENVVTHLGYRNRGFATECLHYAEALAKEAGCYKMMLFTGAKDEATLRVYEKAGYDGENKTAFVRWL